jgi:hypothetical protein
MFMKCWVLSFMYCIQCQYVGTVCIMMVCLYRYWCPVSVWVLCTSMLLWPVCVNTNSHWAGSLMVPNGSLYLHTQATITYITPIH